MIIYQPQNQKQDEIKERSISVVYCRYDGLIW
jgi:hypothetical protein